MAGAPNVPQRGDMCFPGAHVGPMTSEAIALAPGDTLRIERRFVVDGQLTCVTDEGKYAGVERVGTHEHLVLRNKDGVRMFPLTAIAEIKLVKPARRPKPAPAGTGNPPRAAHDPSFA